MPRDSQDGLGWEETGVHLFPQWRREPSIEAVESVCRQRLGIPSTGPCSASFFAGDAMYKLYSVVCAGQSLLMKVLLPVDPHFKTRGEVATLQWVRHHTSIPAPRVVAFEDSNNNDIGFEWILMDLVPGVPAHRRWRTLAMEQKIAITQRLAEFQAELSRCGKPDDAFGNIGTLDFEDGKGAPGTPAPVVPGRLVSPEFFRRSRLNYDVPRGPFRSSHEWLSAGLRLIILEQTAALEKAEDEGDKEDAGEIIGAAQRLLSFLPNVFPPAQEDAAVTALYHDGLALHNILLNDQGEITALLDWECVSAVPTWMATMPPRFLVGHTREEEPKREMYSDETPSGSIASEEHNDPDQLDNENKNELYWIHLMEFDTTQLRQVYRAKMRELWPDWPEEKSYKQVDFFEAFLQCNGELWLKKVNEWVDRLERGDSIRWTELFQTKFGL